MLEDASAGKDKDKGAIPLEKITQWMMKNELLSIILLGSIDQAQYCEKVKRIVEHVAPHLSKEDLEQLWNRTVCSIFAYRVWISMSVVVQLVLVLLLPLY